MLHRYLYKGPVMRFDTCVDSHWEAETMAENEKKAINNFSNCSQIPPLLAKYYTNRS